MSLLLVFITSLMGIILGKLLFKKWINHLTLYCSIFGGTVFLYELKLLPYVDIIPYAWFVMISSFLSFLLGILTIISARNLYQKNDTFIKKTDISLKIFIDDGKTLKYAIIFFSILSLYAAIELWMILINQFGSIPAVFLNANVIYRLNIDGEIKGNTPYIFLLGFAAIFFAGIYAAYKRKFTFLTFIPLISIILRDLATSGRIAMLFALMEFTFAFFLFKHLLNNDLSQRFKFSRMNAIVAPIILISLFIIAASLVRISRSGVGSESFSGASRELRQTKENIIISPTIYLYASSCIGVLSKYFASQGEDTKFGQHSFQSVYLFLAKLDLIKRPSEYQKGYYIPMWTNNATFIRELHADFGIAGVFLVPFLFGLLITWLWFKFYEEKSLIVFAFLVHFYLIIGFSFLLMVTRFIYWTVGLTLILISIPILEKIAAIYGNKKN